jgi:hypothetical protein
LRCILLFLQFKQLVQFFDFKEYVEQTVPTGIWNQKIEQTV